MARGVTRLTKLEVDESIDLSSVISGQLSLSAAGLASLLNANLPPTARIATSDGLTTGLIADGTGFVSLTCDTATKIATLPTPTPGTIVFIHCGATGYELRTNAPATVGINGGTPGAGAESAIPANSLVVAVCVSATQWIAFQVDVVGGIAIVENSA